jgi:hypothetical protein
MLSKPKLRAKTAPANLLVVFLLVELYKPMRGESRTILSCPRQEDQGTAQAKGLQPRRHDFLWVLRPTLAADRSRAPHYRSDPHPDLRDIGNTNRTTGEGIG